MTPKELAAKYENAGMEGLPTWEFDDELESRVIKIIWKEPRLQATYGYAESIAHKIMTEIPGITEQDLITIEEQWEDRTDIEVLQNEEPDSFYQFMAQEINRKVRG